MISFRAAHATAKGDRVLNQDAAYASAHLCAVADGLGGQPAGEVASALAVEALVTSRDSVIARRERPRIPIKRRFGALALPSVAEFLDVIAEVNYKVWEKSQSALSLQGMCSTLCVLAVVERDGQELLAVVNIGDSRVYRCDESGFWQLTQDHTARQEVIKGGLDLSLLKERDLDRLVRAVGYENKVVADDWTFEPITAHRYLLCSDGLTKELADSAIHDILLKFSSPSDAADTLVSQALKSGGRDNVTAVVADVQETL